MTTERIFQGEDQQWYFSVRGNQAAGPFASLQEAETALAEHVQSCRRRSDTVFGWPESLKPSRLLKRPAAVPRRT